MKVFLGGTCNGSTWRDELIPLLNINYFNPVVSDWTDDCYQEELKQREICNYCLYTITPKMTGTYAIAELIDDSNKRPSKTILCILRNDVDLSFSKSQMLSLERVGKMVENNNGTVFFSLENVAEYLNRDISN